MVRSYIRKHGLWGDLSPLWRKFSGSPTRRRTSWDWSTTVLGNIHQQSQTNLPVYILYNPFHAYTVHTAAFWDHGVLQDESARRLLQALGPTAPQTGDAPGFAHRKKDIDFPKNKGELVSFEQSQVIFKNYISRIAIKSLFFKHAWDIWGGRVSVFFAIPTSDPRLFLSQPPLLLQGQPHQWHPQGQSLCPHPQCQLFCLPSRCSQSQLLCPLWKPQGQSRCQPLSLRSQAQWTRTTLQPGCI